MNLEIDSDLKNFFLKQTQPGTIKKTTTASPTKHRKHNHFPMGKQGYVPQSAGQNPYKIRK
jgi:hypothetical protein